MKLIEDMGAGLVWLEMEGEWRIWSLVKLRKPATCAVSGKEIVGAAYRPLTNGKTRMKRISAAVIDAGRAALAEKDKTP